MEMEIITASHGGAGFLDRGPTMAYSRYSFISGLASFSFLYLPQRCRSRGCRSSDPAFGEMPYPLYVCNQGVKKTVIPGRMKGNTARNEW